MKSNVQAKDAWVHLLTSLEEPIKIPIGYFLFNSLNARDRARVILQSIIQAYDSNAVVMALTMDGPSVNKETMRCLGAKIEPKNSQPYFNHPIDPEIKIYCFFDPPHCLKLIRNHFYEKSMWSSKGFIEFKYITKLHEIQQNLQLKLGMP